MTELLTAQQVADVLGVQAVTLTMWRQRGSGPPFIKTPGRHRYLYRRDEVERWAHERGYDAYLAMRNGDG